MTNPPGLGLSIEIHINVVHQVIRCITEHACMVIPCITPWSYWILYYA